MMAQASVRSDSPGPENTLVVIPAWDEAADIGLVVERVKAQGFEVLVVDDHSSDDTAEMAAAAGARVIRLAFHAGSWAAMQTGLRVALKEGFRFTVTIDGDGQHHPEDIPLLLHCHAEANRPLHVVIGACVRRANRRRRVVWKVLRVLSGIKVVDLTSGFRLYDHAAMALLGSSACSLIEYQDIGVLLNLHRHGFHMQEVDVQMGPRLTGHSRIFNTWRVVGHYLIYSLLLTLTRRRYGRSEIDAEWVIR